MRARRRSSGVPGHFLCCLGNASCVLIRNQPAGCSGSYKSKKEYYPGLAAILEQAPKDKLEDGRYRIIRPQDPPNCLLEPVPIWPRGQDRIPFVICMTRNNQLVGSGSGRMKRFPGNIKSARGRRSSVYGRASSGQVYRNYGGYDK
ncbi:hypothetical protein NDU88_010433 [Pleurodeles waltl]|uniref:Uncharacterized protein n=1 Tax=Pleurodeles waltl TaxID=8319 RepID=A0AAV7QY17_PLEWA|nr:hypothetical protein NDU88_010433 [Pleurodeles waltl]